MPVTIQTFFEQIKDAAKILEDSQTFDLIRAVENQLFASKLRLLVVGSVGSGRFSVTNTILEQSKLLPKSSIPKAAIRLNIDYGETISTEVISTNGLKTTFPAEKLRGLLTSPETDPAKYQSIDVKTNSDLVKNCSIVIENITSKKASNEWKGIFAGTDYIILVLNATALLSEKEKQFIRDILTPNFGLERVVILLNQIDLISENERSPILELVKSFLGSYESQPIVMEFSTVKINSDSENPVTKDYDRELLNLLKSDLLEISDRVKLMGIRQALEICLTELEQGATRQKALTTTNEVELQELKSKIDLKNQWLQKRIQRAHNKIEGYINTLIKEELFREIESFSFTLREKLADEIMPVQDVTTIKRYLPGYLETLWTDFFNAQQAWLVSKLTQEMELISKVVKADLKELLGDTAPNFQNWLHEFDPTPTNMISFLMPKRAKNTVGNISTGLQLGGFLLLVTNLPLGLSVIGAGVITRRIGKRSIQNSEKQAIVDSAIKTINEMEQQIKKQIDSNFLQLTEQLKLTITELYNNELVKINSLIEKASISQHKIISKQEETDNLLIVVIPQLRNTINSI